MALVTGDSSFRSASAAGVQNQPFRDVLSGRLLPAAALKQQLSCHRKPSQGREGIGEKGFAVLEYQKGLVLAYLCANYFTR